MGAQITQILQIHTDFFICVDLRRSKKSVSSACLIKSDNKYMQTAQVENLRRSKKSVSSACLKTGTPKTVTRVGINFKKDRLWLK